MSGRRLLTALALCAPVALAPPRDAAAQAVATVGGVRGQVRDRADGNPASGATVIATSPALQGQQIVLADDKGLYFITALPPGLYMLTIVYGNGTFTRGNVLIQVGKEAVVNVTVDTTAAAGKPAGEVIEIKGTVPLIDQGSTKTGVTLTDDYTRNIPVGRTFGQVIGAAAGSQKDFFGTSIAGATSVENTYVVQGINTTDTAYGQLVADLPNEFIQETEVITGGYNAEYGRATGGIVNVVTKSGGNEVHGSVFANYTPGALVAPAKTIQREGNSVDTRTNIDYTYDLGAEVGGPIIKDRLWFHIGVDPSATHETTTRLVQEQVDDNQDGVPDIDPTTGFTKHKQVARRDISNSHRTYYFTAKINGEIDRDNQFEISAFGNPTNGTRPAQGNLVFAPNDTLIDEKTGAYDVSSKYTGKLNGGKTQIDVIAGYHHGYKYDTPLGAVGALPLVSYNYERSLYDFADLEGSAIAACNDHDPNDPYPKIRNCPITNYAEQGLGFLEQRDNDRLTGRIDLTQRVKVPHIGYHTFKGGADIEQSTYNTTQLDTGGVALQRFCNTDPVSGACSDDPGALPGVWQANSYDTIVRNLTPSEVADPSTVKLDPGQALCSGNLAVCGPIDHRRANTSNRSIGAYLQDQWAVLPNFVIDAGLRFEDQIAYSANQLIGTVAPTGEIVPKVAFSLRNWAPRLGVSWDPTEEGKAKVFGHYGRFFENLPMDINVRSFGGEIDNVGLYNATQTSGDPNCAADHGMGNTAQRILQCKDFQLQGLFGGGAEYVAPNLHGQYTDEYVAGIEFEVMQDLKAVATYTHRTMPTIIEDLSTDGGNDYLIANPGVDYAVQAAQLHAQAMAATDPALAQALELRSQMLAFMKKEDPPSRNYDAVTLRVEQRPTQRSLLIASYTYSIEKGNYPGLFSTETNQLDPNNSSQYDLPELLANRYGFLGLDRTHSLKVDGFYLFDLKQIGLVTIGASLRAQSGISHNALASHPTYGQGESYLLPRGSFERSPVTDQLDLHLQYGRHIDKQRVLSVFADVFNVLDQQDELNVDENYTFENANPIVGGDVNDLKHLKSEDANGLPQNVTVTPNKNFGKPIELTLPRSVRFGLRLTF